jgi:putative ABC transport system permease protein
MATRWRKVIADFWSNKTRTILMVITITVGVFALGYVQNTGRMMDEDMDGDYLSSNPAEATIYGWPMDDDSVRTVSKVPGVADVQGQSRIIGQILGANNVKTSVIVTGIESPTAVHVNRLKPADPKSDILPSLSDREILLDRSAAFMGFQPGDQLVIELPDGKHRTLIFNGYVHDVNNIPSTVGGLAGGYVTPETLVWLGGSEIYDQLVISVDKNVTDFDYVTSVAQAAADRLKDSGVNIGTVSVYNPGHHFAWEISQGTFLVLNILGWMTVLLSAVLIVNTIIALMTQQIRQVGIMKSIGGGTSQILWMYFVLIITFGIIALGISIPLAGWAAYKTSLGGFLNFNTGDFRLFPQTIILQAIVALVVPLLAASVPLLNSIRRPVYESLSFNGTDNKRVAKKAATIGKRLVSVSRPIMISLRNAFRKKARMILTVGTLVLGGAIFIAVFNLWSSFDKTMDDVQGYFLADINVNFNRGYRFTKVEELALSVPGVKSVEGWMSTSGQLLNEENETKNEIVLFAPPSTSTLIKPIMTAGRWLTPQDENAVVIGNHTLKIRPDLGIGDWITVEVDGKDTRWKIVGIYSMPGNTNPPLIYTNYEYLAPLINQSGQVYTLRVLTNQHDPENQTKVKKALQEVFDKNKIQVALIQQATEWKAQQTNTTNLLVYFLLVMAILIAIVGGVGMMGTMSINVMERTREIGIMRAIGASDGNIQKIVIVEGIIIGLISWVASFILAIPITSVLTLGVGMAVFQAPIPVVYGWNGTVAWLFGMSILAVLSSAIPARRATKLTVRDTLAYE